MTYIVAELGASHNGNIGTMYELVEAAKWAGADAVKLQTYKPEDMVPNDGYVVKEGTWAGHNLFDLYEKAATPQRWHQDIFRLAYANYIECFSSPFSTEAVDFLETLGCPKYKIASFEIGNGDLLRAVARTGKPAFISTGLATDDEIEAALDIIPYAVLLHCVSAYPAPLEEMNLLRMVSFGDMVGLSDHTIGSEAAVIATALGASVIEKHLMIRRDETGPDSSFSSTPYEFKAMVDAVRRTERALGDGEYRISESEKSNLQFKRRGQYRGLAA